MFLTSTSLYKVKPMTTIAAAAAPIHNLLLRTLISWACAAEEDASAELRIPPELLSRCSRFKSARNSAAL